MKNIGKYSGVLVKSKDKFLLCKRSKFVTMSGIWSIPGGHIEENETPIDAASREFYEETNVKITNPLNLFDIIKVYNDDKTNVVGNFYVFLMESENEINPDLESARDGIEHTECGNFSSKNLPKPLNDGIRKLIEKLS